LQHISVKNYETRRYIHILLPFIRLVLSTGKVNIYFNNAPPDWKFCSFTTGSTDM